MTAILRATGIGKSAGALVVLDGIDFDVSTNEAIGIIGPNGAGKSTQMDVLSGALAPSKGRVEMAGREVTPLAQHTAQALA